MNHIPTRNLRIINKLRILLRSDLFNRFKLNFFGYGYNQVVALLIQFVQVPFFLHNWGSEKYGEWLVLTGIPTVLVFLDMGVAQASATRGTMESSAGRWDSARNIFQTSLVFTTVIGATAVILSILSNQFINWKELLHLNHITNEEAETTIIFMACYLAVQLQGGCAEAWFRIIDRSPVGAFLLGNRRAVDLILYILVLKCGGSVPDLARSLFAGQLILMIFIYLIAYKISTISLFGIKSASLTEFKKIARPAFACLGFPLAQMATIQGSIQILNQTSSPNTVVIFTMCRTLVRVIIQLGIVTNKALSPELSRLVGSGRSQEAASFSKKIVMVCGIVASLTYIGMIVTGPQIIQVWSGGKITTTHSIISLVGIHSVLNIFWYVSAARTIATNSHEGIAWTYCVASLVGLGIWALLGSYLPEILGVSLMIAFPELIMILSLTSLSKKSLATPRSES